MIKGAFTFFLFLFSNNEQAISKKLDGYWYVTQDYTVQKRDLFRFYRWEKCERFEDERLCKGSFGWSKSPENYKNLRDDVTYGYRVEKIEKKKYRILTDYGDYDFILDLKDDKLTMKDIETGDSLTMVKIAKQSNQ